MDNSVTVHSAITGVMGVQQQQCQKLCIHYLYFASHCNITIAVKNCNILAKTLAFDLCMFGYERVTKFPWHL